MATKTSGEIEKEFIENLKKSTGRSLKEWTSTIGEFGTGKRNDIVKRLKEKNGFGHMHATLLAGIYLNAGKRVYGNTDDLLQNQFARAEAMRPLYESFIAFVTKHFPHSSVLPKKTYVSILEKREFAAINIKPLELRVGFDLGERPFDDSVAKSKLSGPMPRISHMQVITDKSQLGNELVNLLKESHRRCH